MSKTNFIPCTVRLASRDELTYEPYYKRLWMASVAQDLSRRKLGCKIELTVYGFEGQFIAPTGVQIPMPNLECIFPDSDYRQLGNFLQRNHADDGPRRMCVRAITQVQMLDLMFRIASPDIARHFK